MNSSPVSPHAVVGNDEVDPAAFEDLQRLRDAPGADGRVTGLGEGVLQNQADRGFVIDVQDRAMRRERAETGSPAAPSLVPAG